MVATLAPFPLQGRAPIYGPMGSWWKLSILFATARALICEHGKTYCGFELLDLGGASQTAHHLYRCNGSTSILTQECQHLCLEGDPHSTCSVGSSLPEYDCGTEFPSVTDELIRQGTMTERMRWPWMVSLWNSANQHICGGVVISKQWILTAAHCVSSTKRIVLGDFNISSHDKGERSTSVEPRIHEGYDSSTKRNDIALLKLPEPLQRYTKFIFPVCLPGSAQMLTQRCVVLGWGQEASLKYVNVTVEPDASCRMTVEESSSRHEYDSRAMLCTISDSGSPCPGDSGGPLMCYDQENKKWTVHGIISMGPRCASLAGRTWVGYSRVARFTQWIISMQAQPSQTVTHQTPPPLLKPKAYAIIGGDRLAVTHDGWTWNVIWEGKCYPSQDNTTGDVCPTTSGIGGDLIGSVSVTLTTVYAGTRNGLSYSTDGGRSWETKWGWWKREPQVRNIFASANRVYMQWCGITWVVKEDEIRIVPIYYKDVPMFVAGTRVYLAKGSGVDFSDDEGQTWTSTSPIKYIVTTIFALGDKLLVGSRISLYMSEDHGRRWREWDPPDWDTNRITAVAITASEYVVGTRGGLFISQDRGQTWHKVYPIWGSWIEGIFPLANRIYVAARDKGLFLSEDGGRTWTNWRQKDGLGSDRVISCFALLNNTIYAGTEAGLSISKDGGQTWVTRRRERNWRTVSSTSERIYVATWGNGVLVSLDRGTTWIARSEKHGVASDWVAAVLALDDPVSRVDKVYAATQRGLSISWDSGETWTTRTQVHGLGSNRVLAVSVLDGRIYAATRRGLFSSWDDGETWTQLHRTEMSFVFATPSGLVYTGNKDGLLSSIDEGQTWNVSSGWGHRDFTSVFVSPNGTIYAGTKRGLFLSRGIHEGWHKLPLAEEILSISVLADASIVYVGTTRRLLASRDSGWTWVEVLGSRNVRVASIVTSS